MTDELFETKIERIRYFVNYNSLVACEITNEITFLNISTGPIDIIQYDIREYILNLTILDTNGEKLEFSHSQNAGLNGNSEYLIDIYLPSSRLLQVGERKTLTLKFLLNIGDNVEDTSITKFEFLLQDDINWYLVIKSVEKFNFNDYCYLYDENDNPIDLEILERQNCFFQSESGQNSVIYIKGDGFGKKLLIYHQHKLRKTLLDWINIGYYFGLSSIILISIFIALCVLKILTSNFVVSDFSPFIGYQVFVITTLVIIKGWVFLKDVDHLIENYDKKYLLVLKILLAQFCILLFLIAVGIFTGHNNIGLDSIPFNGSTTDLICGSENAYTLKEPIIISENYNSNISINVN